MSVDVFLPQCAARAVADLENISGVFARLVSRFGEHSKEVISALTPDTIALLEEINFIAPLLRSAVHVVLPKNGEVYRSNWPRRLPTPGEIESLEGLPAPVTCFEFVCDSYLKPTRIIAIVIDKKQLDLDDGLLVFQLHEDEGAFVPTRNGVLFPKPLTFVEPQSDGKIAVNAHVFRISKQRPAVQDVPGVVGNVLRGVHAAIQCCHSLRAGARLEEHVEKSASRRWKMEKRGVGGFTYHVLRLPGRVQGKEFDAQGTHAAPRLHVRRAHIRKLPTGVLTFVKQCFVGDPAKGVVDKHYKVI